MIPISNQSADPRSSASIRGCKLLSSEYSSDNLWDHENTKARKDMQKPSVSCFRAFVIQTVNPKTTTLMLHNTAIQSADVLGPPLGALGVTAVQNRFSKPKWKVEWKIDGNNFPLGRLGTTKIVGKIADQLSRKWNFLSIPKNSEWKVRWGRRSAGRFLATDTQG